MSNAANWNLDKTTTVDGGIKVVTEQGAEIIIRLDTDDGQPRLMLEPQAGVHLAGEEPGIYYVEPA